jgi:hypothetical protein
MTLGEALLDRVREGSQELWRGVRRRMGIRLVLAVLLVHGAFFGILWLLGGAWQDGRHREVALGVARVLLPVAGICGGVLMAFRGSLHAVVVAGPFLRSMADLLLDRRMAWASGDPMEQLAAFASPQALAGAARIRDLPLLLFLSRTILRLEAKSLLRAFQIGAGREALLGEMERQVRGRSARSLRRLAGAVWFGLALAVALSFAAGWVFH